MKDNGRNGFVAISAGNPTAVPTPDAWAATTAYRLDQVVTVGTGADEVQARCILAHTSGSGAALTSSGGTLGGDDSDNLSLIHI